MYAKKQKQNRIIGVIIVLIMSLLGLAGGPVFGQESKQQVLILNSYHANLTWTSDLAGSIQNQLKNSNLNLNLYTEYMDWKTFLVIKI